jgi:hypothetical protein
MGLDLLMVGFHLTVPTVSATHLLMTWDILSATSGGPGRGEPDAVGRRGMEEAGQVPASGPPCQGGAEHIGGVLLATKAFT